MADRRVSLFLLGVVFLACGTARGAPRERETWHAYVADDGKRYGSLHVKVVRLADGNYRFVRQSRLLLDVIGLNKEEIEEHAEYVVTPAYCPVSIEIKIDSGQGQTKARVSGRMNRGMFEVSSTRAGVERRRAFSAAFDLLLGPCFEDWLADRPATFQTGKVTLFDEETSRTQSAAVSRLSARAPGTAWLVDLGPMEGTHRIDLDPDGLLLARSSEGVGLALQRCSAEDARKLVYRKLDGRDMLMIPVDQEVGSPERLASLTVELQWKEIPFERFRLSDERQNVVEHSEEGGKHRAVVRIDAPEPVTDVAQLPIQGAEFAPFLGESPFIEPHDPQVVAIARQVVADKKDALEVVKALSRWVSQNVEPVMIAETLSGPEVLACRKGKCTEYATLFASMARSVGVPTRIVLGERMGGGQWAGHMWNEAYVGRWISVDASCDEVGSSFSLLKFIDHETVGGTQELRRKLPASLEIKIGAFHKQASPLADKIQTGIKGHVYTNADYGFRVTAPGDDWSIQEKSQPGAVVLRFKVPRRDDAQLHFVAFPLPAGVAPKVLLGARLAHYKGRLKGLEIVTDKEFRVHGLDGRKVELKHTATDGKTHRTTEVIWRTAAAGYLLTLDAEESVFDELEKDFTSLLDHFENLEAK